MLKISKIMKSKISILLSMLIIALVMIQCSEDNEIEEQQGELSVKLTDAPSDDTNIQGTFVTVSEVHVNGQKVEGFTKQTIEVSAYQNGNAKLLANEMVEAGNYSSLTVVLDNQSDENGDSPGCYVLTDDNSKHSLESSSSSTTEVTFNKPFAVEANGMTTLVIDFDLRKAIIRNEDTDSGSDYKFVTTAELINSLRIVEEDNCGEIEGTISNNSSSDDKLVVYAYEKGTFDTSTETSAQGESMVLFVNAKTSATVDGNGNYQLSFLEEGEYEIHVASYEEDSSGEVTFNGAVNVTSIISDLLLNSIQVEANSQVNLDMEISVL